MRTEVSTDGAGSTSMKRTYTAVEVSTPGVLQVVERPLAEPSDGQVRIRVEACGVCHTDAATVTGVYPGLTLLAYLDMKSLAASTRWAAACPDGKSVSGSVSASSAARTACANRADVETS